MKDLPDADHGDPYASGIQEASNVMDRTGVSRYDNRKEGGLETD